MIRYNTFLGVYQARKSFTSQWYEVDENTVNIMFEEGYYYV